MILNLELDLELDLDLSHFLRFDRSYELEGEGEREYDLV